MIPNLIRNALFGLILFFLIIGGVFFVWFFFLRAPTPTEISTDTATGSFPVGFTQTVGVSTPTNPTSNEASDTQPSANTTADRIFRVGEGPIAGATILQTLRPTTTVARYVRQDNGHVFDIPLDSPGAVPRSISNTTIPGIARVLWGQGGNAALLQYLDNNTVKTVYLGLPSDTQATTTRGVAIRFLPDGIQDIAVSPDGSSLAYILETASGIAGYTAQIDGLASKQMFSLPITAALVAWPSQKTLVVQSKSAAGAPGIAFSVNLSNGSVVPLLYAPGLTLTADPKFSYLVYQTTANGVPTTYARQVGSGKTSSLSYDPYPEKCIWGLATSTYLYCATPLAYTEPNYLDSWHRGVSPAFDSILVFDVATGNDAIIATPGGDEGGVDSAIETMTVSRDNAYLLFVRRGDYSLWGVRI